MEVRGRMTQEAQGKLERPLGAVQQTPLPPPPRERISLGTRESSRKLETPVGRKAPWEGPWSGTARDSSVSSPDNALTSLSAGAVTSEAGRETQGRHCSFLPARLPL